MTNLCGFFVFVFFFHSACIEQKSPLYGLGLIQFCVGYWVGRQKRKTLSPEGLFKKTKPSRNELIRNKLAMQFIGNAFIDALVIIVTRFLIIIDF